MAKATVIGLAGLKRALEDAASETRRGAEQAVKDETEAIRDDARRIAPVKTGELRRKIDADADGLEGEVRSRARHSTFVEHGTYRDKAQPFMEPAAALSRRRLPKRAAAIIRTFLEG